MRYDNIIRNEQDILVETYIRAQGLIVDIKNVINNYDSITESDKKYLITNTETEINNILNIAFNNLPHHNYLSIEDLEHNMPENYVKPDKEYMNLLNIAYQMNNNQFERLLKSAKDLLNQ